MLVTKQDFDEILATLPDEGAEEDQAIASFLRTAVSQELDSDSSFMFLRDSWAVDCQPLLNQEGFELEEKNRTINTRLIQLENELGSLSNHLLSGKTAITTTIELADLAFERGRLLNQRLLIDLTLALKSESLDDCTYVALLARYVEDMQSVASSIA